MRRLRALLVAAVFLLASCGGEDGAVTTSEVESLRFLALGDSYTIGESVDPSERWPEVLADRLEEEGLPPVEVKIIARTGWTTNELDAGITAADPEGPYDLVTLQIGVNDQFRGFDIEVFRAEFVALLDRAIGFADGDEESVIVVSIPDWGVTPFASSYDSEQIAAEIDDFNAVAREEAERAGAHWVDVTGISRSGGDELVADDGLHPSAEQYRLWVEEILPVAVSVLEG